MNIFRGGEYMLIDEIGKMKDVGAIYEVANIVQDHIVVLRDARTKIAVSAIEVDVFDQYFKKSEDVNGFTPWRAFTNSYGEVIAQYRTNGRKVQIKDNDGFRGEAACNVRHNDKFDLTFGINLAYARCEERALNALKKKHENLLSAIDSSIAENNTRIKRLLRSISKDNGKDS